MTIIILFEQLLVQNLYSYVTWWICFFDSGRSCIPSWGSWKWVVNHPTFDQGKKNTLSREILCFQVDLVLFFDLFDTFTLFKCHQSCIEHFLGILSPHQSHRRSSFFSPLKANSSQRYEWIAPSPHINHRSEAENSSLVKALMEKLWQALAEHNTTILKQNC